MKSVVYLCCPVQPRDGWAYLTALTTFLKGDWDGNESPRLLPARQLDFQDPDTSQIFTETHNLANWVVNFDELLDRRQLMNQSVRVIRYKQFATQGRNLIISSKAPLGLLRSMVLRRLNDLNLDLDAAEYARLAERFIDDANDISGDIVLRAAKRGRNASELMGIVLSRYLVRSELGAGRHFGWYFLDDYASWLGQREEQIADVLALSPEEVDGGLRLTALVVESKYIDGASLAAKRKESQNQLRQTVRRIRDAIFGAPHRLDRELWLARLSDLLLDGVQFPASAKLNLDRWRRGIREGDCELHVRGYSHVFVPSPAELDDCSDFAQVADLDDSYQEIFGRPRVRDLVLRYHRDEDPMPVRAVGADPRVWANRTYVRSSDHTALQVSLPVEAPEPAITPDERQSEAPTVVVQVGSLVFPTPTPASAASAVTVGWAFPGIAELLGQCGASMASPDDETWLRQVEVRARSALQQFQLQSKLTSSVLTPNAALLKFAGSSNLTVDQVLRRRSEFLTTHGLNVISVQPEPGVVAIALERPRRQLIHLEELWGRWSPTSAAGNLDLLIGIREDDGELLMLSPGKEHAPHTLIAGSTGSGKSVLMQNIILGIAATNTPEQARIILIDPKQGVDYFAFESLPHLDGGIIDDQTAALERINALVLEMDERYRRLREARTPNLAVYNQRVPVDERMAIRWLIHDEFAEWMMIDDYKQEVTAAVARLGVKARAAGIHLVFAAQRPDANVMPMQLRANLGNRLILRVDSEGTSEIALGDKGAERLLGRGHLLAKLEGQYGLKYAQVPFAAPDFIDSLTEVMRHHHSVGNSA
jgi:S-DNA-T family DNA segregation ATPase FtsK/SpoIIIE